MSKLFYEAGDRGIWSQDSNLILKDRVIESWEGGHALIFMKRIPGESVSDAWPKLSTDETENVARQTAEYLPQLRKSKVPGSLGPLASEDKFRADMKHGLSEAVPEAARI
ncbi:uncharacterized protein BDW43DRAFT_314251 [Aspergillus alliaceus]|uniref:uncharacterized protein n=1 Tax=Petromyces alliaceus TaxID=209559 RepID=UPI0012A62AE7|nr:uncharacterized protein BDW43DRAFT_314251 [Aspergillus alliaceus]KAB8230196.1 hypothetical protein BDW43DRAFT_314251 [Aspergillus alliaceus]